MPVSLQNNLDFGVVTLLSILSAYAEADTQSKPYLVKGGVNIIL